MNRREISDVAQRVHEGAYDPPDHLFLSDRPAYAEAIRRLEERFEADVLAALGWADGRPARAILAAARSLAPSEDRLAVLQTVVRLCRLLREIRADVPALKGDASSDVA